MKVTHNCEDGMNSSGIAVLPAQLPGYLFDIASPSLRDAFSRIRAVAIKWQELSPVVCSNSADRVMPQYPHSMEPIDDSMRSQIRRFLGQTSEEIHQIINRLSHGGRVDLSELSTSCQALFGFLVRYWDETFLACAEFEADSLADESVKTTIFAIAIAIEAGYSANDVIDIGVCALICDFGMSQIKTESFATERVVGTEGYQEIHRHVIHTLELSQLIDGLSDQMQAICFQVHERPNGTGYPMGLNEEQIHPWAQAITVASTYASLVTRKSYRHQAIAFSAINAIITLRSRQALCGRFVQALVSAVSIYPIGSRLLLPDGRTARVMRRRFRRPAAPIIQIENEAGLQEIPSNDNQGVTAICALPFEEEFVSLREIEFQRIR